MRKIVIVIIICAFFAGCASTDKKPVIIERDAALPHIKHIAVVPFYNLSVEQNVPLVDLTDVFYSELQKFNDFIVTPPLVVDQSIIENDFILPRDGRALCEKLQVDAVIMGFITHYDPYENPRIGIALLIIPAEDLGLGGLSPEVILKLQQSGKPFELPEGGRLDSVAYVSEIYDSSEDAVLERLKAYASGYREEETGLGYKGFLRVTDKYMQFVSYEIIRELIRKVDEHYSHPLAF